MVLSLKAVTTQDDRAGAPLLLAPSGERLALRHEMRRPFAAWLARQAAAAAQGELLGVGMRRVLQLRGRQPLRRSQCFRKLLATPFPNTAGIKHCTSMK
jgi:hypothetical protein